MSGCRAGCATGGAPAPPSPPPERSDSTIKCPPCALPQAPDIFAPPCMETRPYKACPSSSRALGGVGSYTGGAGTVGGLQGKMLTILTSVRDPLAEHQASQGLPKEEQYTFVDLVKALCTHSYQAILTIFTMLYNLIPFLDGFLYLTRFVLDKLIEICKCESRSDLIFAAVLFGGEMIVIIAFIVVISGFIIVPVWSLTYSLLRKFSIMGSSPEKKRCC